jgi:5-methylcytosine-specific restriction protein A
MNGSSPTLWLQDDKAPEVAAALWDHPSVRDLATLEIVTPIDNQQTGLDDTFDDIPGLDYSLLGSDGGAFVAITRSYVKRDQRVRRVVLQRAKGRCERKGCGATWSFPGFLDVHHILGAGKSDRVWNCVALCPNCHREAHTSPNRDQINEDFLHFALRFKDHPPIRHRTW